MTHATPKHMAEGQVARIVGFLGNTPQHLSKLLALGFTRGTPIKLIRNQGGLVEVEVRGTSVCLREKESEILWLELAEFV